MPTHFSKTEIFPTKRQNYKKKLERNRKNIKTRKQRRKLLLKVIRRLLLKNQMKKKVKNQTTNAQLALCNLNTKLFTLSLSI